MDLSIFFTEGDYVFSYYFLHFFFNCNRSFTHPYLEILSSYLDALKLNVKTFFVFA